MTQLQAKMIVISYIIFPIAWWCWQLIKKENALRDNDHEAASSEMIYLIARDRKRMGYYHQKAEDAVIEDLANLERDLPIE